MTKKTLSECVRCGISKEEAKKEKCKCYHFGKSYSSHLWTITIREPDFLNGDQTFLDLLGLGATTLSKKLKR